LLIESRASAGGLGWKVRRHGTDHHPDRCHHFRGFVYERARFSTDKKSIEVVLRPCKGSAAGHGDPALHAVEIYKGRPILYDLGNYIFESPNPLDVYGPLAYMSAVAQVEFSGGRLTVLSFRPIVLSLNESSGAPRGTPYLAEGGEAAAILGRLAEISRRYGTEIRIENETGRAVIGTEP
jgi:hypothetical protein